MEKVKAYLQHKRPPDVNNVAWMAVEMHSLFD